MTIFEAYLKFNGLACPYCNEKVNIDYNGNTLHEPFMEFVSHENTKKCCLKFHKQLTDCILRYRNGYITEPELMREIRKFKNEGWSVRVG